ncbi:MAG: hypothetical protein ACSLFK_01170 [Gemmatimonadaceae bacterium]
MIRSLRICAAALVFAACTEPTAPSAVQDIAPRLARPIKGDGGLTVNGNLQNNTFAFSAADLGRTGSSNTALAVLDQTAQAVASLLTEEMPAKPGDYVLGRLNNQQVVIGIAPGATKFELNLDFYAIGSWDGAGQQTQQGAFGQDSWAVVAECGDNLVDVFATSFSNQKAVQQHYPSTLDGKRNGWLKNSAGSNVTGFDANVPLFSSVKDSWYKLSFKGSNPCGSAEFKSLRLLTPGFDLQSRDDESWAVDNIVIKTD